MLTPTVTKNLAYVTMLLAIGSLCDTNPTQNVRDEFLNKIITQIASTLIPSPEKCVAFTPALQHGTLKRKFASNDFPIQRVLCRF